MKARSKFITAVLAATVASASLAQVARAEATSTTTQPAAATQQIVKASDITLSGEAQQALLGVHYARMALADGNTDAAKQILEKASGYFGDATAKLAVKTDSGYGVPVDAGLGFAENFKMMDQHKDTFANAQQLMQKGDIDGVFHTLKSGGIDVFAELAVLPYKATVDGLQQAISQIDAGTPDKAAATLESIEASVAVKSFAPDQLPTQGYASADILQG